MKLLNILRKVTPRFINLLWHKVNAILAAFIYRFPAKNLKVIGITGTDGKTTTCNFIASILEVAQKKVGLATTVNLRIAGKEKEMKSDLTTVGPFQMQKILSQMVKEKVEYAVIEVSSHAIEQSRIWGIEFNVAVFTNLSPEHLDYHKTYAHYKRDKGRLFQSLRRVSFIIPKKHTRKISVVNIDDKEAPYFLSFKADKYVCFGISKNLKKYNVIKAININLKDRGTEFTLVTPDGDIALHLNIPGKFNVYNALAAASVTWALDFGLEAIRKGIEDVKGIPGRMEEIKTDDSRQNFRVLVDFAHTPQAIREVLESLRKIFQAPRDTKNYPTGQGRIIAVFGSAGDRDRKKRPEMGKVAGKIADMVILTTDDPRQENPAKIVQDIAKGLKEVGGRENTNYLIILDRKEAIKEAIREAREGDVVVIMGIGHHRALYVKDKKIPWDDREVAREATEEILKDRD